MIENNKKEQPVLVGTFNSYMLLAFFLCASLIFAVDAKALTLDVQGLNRDGTPNAAVTEYRWTIEEDATYHVPFNSNGNPIPDANTLSVSFHQSYMPVVASGDNSTAFPPACTGGADPICLDPAKNYFISVIPTASGSYSIGGAPFKGDAETVAVTLNQLPLPTAQITVLVFNDNFPINNAPDLPEETGLAGFSIVLEDGGGRYGMSAGVQMMDAFGNPLGTAYQFTDSNGNGIHDSGEPYVLDVDGTPIVAVMGDGVILTDANGEAVIKNLAPGKYGIQAVPPDAVKDAVTGKWVSSNWTQTATIEGTKIIDAWVKANEPPYFQEFGPPGWHVFIGFVNAGPNKPFVDATVLSGGSTISGQVVNLHMSRPPDYAFYDGAPLEHTRAWVGLNMGLAGAGNGVYAARANSDGTFSIPNVPAGDYQLAIWDDALDQIFAFYSVTVPTGGGPVDLATIPVFQWFTRQEHYVFNDLDGDGIRDPGEAGIPNQAVNIRWRDGTMYQSAPTDGEGFVPFDEVFPFFAWQIAEVDFASALKATGVTITVDGGGPIPWGDPWAWGDQLNPQPQSENAGLPYRTETGPVLLEAFQGMIGQTSVLQWGKAAYGAGENGGITGVVYYSTTRAENNPQYGAAEPWEPGIPRVQVNLYRDADGDGAIDDFNDSGSIELADVDNYPFGWSTGGTKGAEDVENSGSDGLWDKGDALEVTHTDSWDDNPPNGCQGDPFVFQGSPKDCYDGLRNFNQVRPGVFDGGYAFGSPVGGTLAAGTYIVETIPPPGYEIVKEEDKNVDFGEDLIPGPLALPPVCVGDDHPVPQYLTLFEDQMIEVAGWTPGMTRPYCDKKQVYLSDGQNAAADFFLFTKAPIAGHIYGFILDDTQNEFDPNAPNFGEKYAPPWMPISIRDWTGHEISRTYSDQYGTYNALVPSTYSANLPQPSGMSPSMITVCLNDPNDPLHNPQYSQYCYTFQYMPGTTTYLDTPVLPVAAFAGPGQYPLDCEFPSGTPRISSVDVQTNGVGGGPYIPATAVTTGPPSARGVFPNSNYNIIVTSEGSVGVPNPAYDGIGGTQPKTIQRDYGFGASQGTGTVMLGTVPLTISSWSDTSITATVSASTNLGQIGGSQLTVARDNGLSTITGVTVQVGLRQGAAVRTVPSLYGSIQAAIDAAGANDLILVGPGTYEELVIMWKPVQLQGWGAGAVRINAVKSPAEKLLAWRNNVTNLIANGDVDLLPEQEVGGGVPEPVTLFNEEGPGVIVLAKGSGPDRFARNQNQGARIDGITITGADHAGGIIVNGYADYLDISNNRIISNNGVFGGGIRIGHPILTTIDGLDYADAQNDNIRIHHNHITQNSGLNELGGGVSLCTGSDAYQLTDNFICGNFAQGGGGGIGHQGLSDGGLIAHNTILFNESFQQGITVNGGGIVIAGGAPLGGAGSLSPGAGSLRIDANFIQGNAAGAGDGGGIRLTRINGQDVAGNPSNPNQWYKVDILNNMIFNNVAALAGGGISLQDSVRVNIVNNTIANNDSTATAGEAFEPGSPSASTPQPAGIVARAHSAQLSAASAMAGTFSNPLLQNDIIWHNRSFSFFLNDTTDPPTFGLVPDVGSGAAPDYWDLAVLGTTGTLTALDSLLTGGLDPVFVAEYLNGDRGQTILQPEITTSIQAPPAFDEGGNFIRVHFGPLTQTVFDTTASEWVLRGDYHITAGSSAENTGSNLVVGSFPALEFDIDGETRPNGNVDIGADERH